jgi:hypothetical protein
MYSVGSMETFIEDSMQNDRAKLDLTSVIARGKFMNKDLPLEPKITKKEALAGMSKYAFYVWVSGDEDG